MVYPTIATSHGHSERRASRRAGALVARWRWASTTAMTWAVTMTTICTYQTTEVGMTPVATS